MTTAVDDVGDSGGHQSRLRHDVPYVLEVNFSLEHAAAGVARRRDRYVRFGLFAKIDLSNVARKVVRAAESQVIGPIATGLRNIGADS